MPALKTIHIARSTEWEASALRCCKLLKESVSAGSFNLGIATSTIWPLSCYLLHRHGLAEVRGV